VRNMDGLQEELIELSKQYEAGKEAMKILKQKMLAVMTQIGVGNHFQDPADNTVFQIVKPTGTFISFDDLGYERTKRTGEVKGSMSMKKAQELGYTL
jgi:predicted metal-dependent phosphotriesterase family hydrolase